MYCTGYPSTHNNIAGRSASVNASMEKGSKSNAIETKKGLTGVPAIVR